MAPVNEQRLLSQALSSGCGSEGRSLGSEHDSRPGVDWFAGYCQQHSHIVPTWVDNWFGPRATCIRPLREGYKKEEAGTSGSGSASVYSGASTIVKGLRLRDEVRKGVDYVGELTAAQSLVNQFWKSRTVYGTSLAQALEIEGLLDSVQRCMNPYKALEQESEPVFRGSAFMLTVLPVTDQEISCLQSWSFSLRRRDLGRNRSYWGKPRQSGNWLGEANANWMTSWPSWRRRFPCFLRWNGHT